MTMEEHLKQLIGNLTVRLAQVMAENDALQEELAALKTKIDTTT